MNGVETHANFKYYILLDLLFGLRILGIFVWMTKNNDM